MKRTMTVLFTLALLVAFSGSAMAQTVMNTFAATEDACGDDYITTDPIAIFPYFPAIDDGYWRGFALINKDDTDTIPANALCLVGIDAEGEGFAKIYPNPIYPQNMKVALLEDVDADEDGWKGKLYMGVYAVNAVYNDNELAGFAMVGDGEQAQGYFAGGTPAATLAFNYLPQAPWWRGLAIVNTDDDAIEVTITVTQENGTVVTEEEVDIAAGAMLVDFLDNLVEDLDDTQRAYVTVETANADLLGFAMFGDGVQAMGYLAD